MKLRIKKGFVTQKSGESITIFDTEKSVLHTFNPTATYIFEKLKEKMDPSDIASQIRKEFNLTEKKAKRETDDFIQVLISKRILEKRESK